MQSTINVATPPEVPGRVLPRVFTSLQAMRAIAALMVVLFHTALIYSLPSYWHNLSWRNGFAFGQSGVGIFFILSGIVILYAHWNDLDRPSRLKRYALKRFRRIYPIYWIVLAIVLPVYLLHPAFGAGYERSPFVIASSVLLVHLVQPFTVLAVAWTLFHEVMFYILFSAFILSRTIGVALFGIWLALSVLAIWFPPASAVLYQYVSPLHLLFGAGVAIGWAVRVRPLPAPLAFVFIGLAGFVIACLGEIKAWPGFRDHLDLHGTPGDLALGFTAALILWGLLEQEQRGRFTSPKFLLLLGDASYSIYLVHFPVISFVAKVLYRILKPYSIPAVFPFFAMAFLGTLSGLLVHLYVERPLLTFLSRNDGRVHPTPSSKQCVEIGRRGAGPEVTL